MKALKIGKTDLFVKTMTNFKKDALNNSLHSLRNLIYAIDKIISDKDTITRKSLSDEDSYLVDYNHYLFTSLMVPEEYSGVTINDIHYVNKFQDCIMDFVDSIWTLLENKFDNKNDLYYPIEIHKEIWNLHKTISQYIGKDIEIYSGKYDMYFGNLTIKDIRDHLGKITEVLEYIMEYVNK